MRFESRTWYLLSVLLLVAALFFWLYGNEYQAKKNTPTKPDKSNAATPSSSATNAVAVPTRPFPLLTRLPTNSLPQAQGTGTNPAPASASAPSTQKKNPFPYRLSNSARSLDALTRSDAAILLRNALIETTEPLQLAIPNHLRSAGDPGSYIIQARGLIGEGFRARLREAGASIISYIPNNAFLVRVPAKGADQLAALPETQAIIPYEPYYKLDRALLPVAVEQQPLPADRWLRVTLFPGERDSALQAVTALGAELISEEPSPFGPQLLIQPTPDSLPGLARLSSVQGIEPFYKRAVMNDLARVRLGVSTDSIASTNYLGLTGTNVIVAVTDTGIDTSHPGLVGRVILSDNALATDRVGHGTHVAGTIAGNGAQSPPGGAVLTGSPTNANFRGMAPQAKLFGLPLRITPELNPVIADTYLLETTAQTNLFQFKRANAPMISNNSWTYPGANDYDSSAARFDAAARDALPQVTNAQPIIFVFAAGNAGEGSDNGLNGDTSSISSPATAKNVITVGAIEQLRNLTNQVVSTTNLNNFTGTNGVVGTNSVVGTNGVVNTNSTVIVTNTPYLGMTDSDNEVAAYSSRGNIGIGSEGQFGRFKPDVVAPGSYLISARSKDWTLESQNAPGSPEYKANADLLAPLLPHYRYDTGTSMAAPTVAGVLALMQEFFEQKLPANLRRTNSPALMKAALINGARSIGTRYDFQVQSTINYQGWGLVNLPNTLPALLLSQPEAAWPIRFIDQSPSNALPTGQSRAWNLTLSTNNQDIPLRVTLVWTDPPGNPNAGIKLVNDLDLVVSNTVTHQVYYGNNIPVGSDFTPPSDTNSPPTSDLINNVENVYIRDPAGSNFVVTVQARRVNVNSVTDYFQVTKLTNDVAQDFALVISTEDLTLTNAFTLGPVPDLQPVTPSPLMVMTNGLPILKQRVGANPSLFDQRNGLTNQWNFFVFTNTYVTNNFASITNGTNVAFVTFIPPNVSRARNQDSDVELYVSKDSKLLALNSSTLDGAFKSTKRGGTESIVFTNAALGDVFYIGVKSEDQQAGEYGLIALSSNDPFEQDDNGDKILRGFPMGAVIPDGSANSPGGVQVIAIGISPTIVRSVIVTNILTHENVGDLIGILSHDQSSVVLNNHSLNDGRFAVTNEFFIYDDNGFNRTLFSRPTDGPGSLNSFVGQEGSGVWLLNMVDNSPSHTGRVEVLTLRIRPFDNGDLGAAGIAGIHGTVGPDEEKSFFHDVPPEATNLIIRLSQMTGPLEVFIRRGTPPTTNEFDKMALINPPGGDLTLNLADKPLPLLAGRYFISVHNPSTANTVSFHVTSFVELSTEIDSGLTMISTNALPILDNATLFSTFDVAADKEITDVQVGVRIDHPRSSDLALRLVSPQGTTILLAENRGGTSSLGYGAGYGSNLTYTVFTEQTNLFGSLLPMKFATVLFTNSASAPTAIQLLADSFENAAPGSYLSNSTVSGWTVSSGKVQLHGVTNIFGITANSGTNFLELDTTNSSSAILRTLSTSPGTPYLLSLTFRQNPAGPAGAAQALQVSYGSTGETRPVVQTIPISSLDWQTTNIVLQATGPITSLELSSLTSAGVLIDDVRVTDLPKSTNRYVLPEESLNQLRGERAVGEWKLEVADTRSGPAGGVLPTLLGWQLQIKYGEPRQKAIVLTNGISYLGAITNSQTNYFIVEICANTSTLLSELTGPRDKLMLLADRSGLPTGRLTTDDFDAQTNTFRASTNSGMASLLIRTNQPVPLQPGKRFFLAVHNIGLTDTNIYSIQVNMDRDDCHGTRGIARLFSGVSYTNSIPSTANLLQYYVFTSSCLATNVRFEVTPQSEDVALVVRKGPLPPLPDLTRFDYASDRPGTTNELISISTNSLPVPLGSSDDWFLGVYNKGTNPVVYSIRATEFSGSGTGLGGTSVTRLTNAVPLNFTIGYCPVFTNYFRFTITNSAPAVRFSLSNLSGDADLYLGYNGVPTRTSYFQATSFVGTLAGQTIISTNRNLPQLNGDWYLLVVSRVPANLSFTVLAELLTQPPPAPPTKFIDPRLEVRGTSLCLSWPSQVGTNYVVEARVNIDDPVWTRISSTITAVSTTSEHCIALPTPYRFFQIEVIGATPPPPPPPGQFINPRLTVSGTNLCLNWLSSIGTNYVVEAKTNITDATWARISPVITATGTNSQHCIGLPTPYRFFQIEIVGASAPPPPAPPSQFISPRLTVSGTNLCLNWLSSIGTNYVVEAKTNITDNAWAKISPVITATGTNSQHCLNLPTPYRFFQIEVVGATTPTPPAPPSQFINPRLIVTGTNVCLNWASLIGTNYVVQAKTNITDSTWVRLLPAITATSTNSQYCLAIPTPYRFFQIEVVGGTPVAPAPSIVLLTNNVFFTNTISATNALQYYQFTVSSNGATVNFELNPRTGDLGLVLRKGLPLPDRTNFVYSSDRAGLTNEIITVTTNSTPLPLSTGDWYLGVFNKVTNAVIYTIRATAVTNTTSTIVSTNITLNAPSLVGTNSLCLSWRSSVGFKYHLEGRRDIATGSWTNISGTITATNANTSYCVSLPTTYRFFRIVEESTAPAAVGLRVGASVIASDKRVELTWNAVLGQRYDVQVLTNLLSTNWITLTNLVATNAVMTLKDPSSSTNASVRFYRVRQSP
jgi:subtilisin-like proprotein convertase family protein/subtilisin family serine protease